MGFPRTLEWVAIPSLGDLPDPGIEPMSPALAEGFFATEPPGKPISVLGLLRQSSMNQET